MKRSFLLFVPSLTGCLLVASLLSSCTGTHIPSPVSPAEDVQRIAEPKRLNASTSVAEPKRLDEPKRVEEFTRPADVRPVPPAPSPALAVTRVQYGVASWYGRGFHGRQTASGEIYNMYRPTAAHRYAPLGTYALVTNLANGQSVRVRINDRGPYIRHRHLDLSYEAARQINMVHAGSTRVKIEFLSDTLPVYRPIVQRQQTPPDSLEAREAPAPEPAGARVWVDVAPENLETFYRTRLGPFASYEEAEQVARQARARGYSSSMVFHTE